MAQKNLPASNKILAWGLKSLIVLLPLQTLLTVWFATNFGHLYIVTAWKEVLIAILAVVALRTALQYPGPLKAVDKRLVGIIGIYVLLVVGYILIAPNQFRALVAGAINVRFLVVFVVAWICATYSPKLTKQLVAGVLVMAVLLAGLGLLQSFLLPTSSLEFFGYDGPDQSTIGIPPAYHTVADSDIIRAQGTLRGPNVYGAFFILPIVLLLFMRPSRINKRLQYGLSGLLFAGLLVSYSRSALLGALVAVAVWFGIHASSWIRAHAVWLVAGVAGLLVVAVLLVPRVTYFRQTILHTSNSDQASGSNEGHLDSVQAGVRDVADHPLGSGLGTAGPVSTLDNGTPKVAENYFLQIGQELGWAGLALLAAIHGYVAYKLWRLRRSPSARALLAALAGLVITNLLLHTWADEAVAVTWWLLAGSVLGSETAIIKHKNYGSTKKANK